MSPNRVVRGAAIPVTAENRFELVGDVIVAHPVNPEKIMGVESYSGLMRGLIPFSVLLIALSVATSVGEESEPSQRSAEMQEIARSIALKRVDRAKAGPPKEPIYRFDDPTRDFSDGTVWTFGETGRPPALLTISLKKYPPKTVFWLLEFTSLADGPVQVDAGRSQWSPEKPGIETRPIPDAPRPADDAAKRLLQMRALSRRFGGHELFEPVKEGRRTDRFDLRLLPTPVHRYQDPDRGFVDGGLFLLVYGRNPEVALVVEAQRGSRDELRWVYGLGRISSAHLKVNLDGHEVADFPQLSSHSPTDVYGVTSRPSKETLR
jgi:hypothetical protein